MQVWTTRAVLVRLKGKTHCFTEKCSLANVREFMRPRTDYPFLSLLNIKLFLRNREVGGLVGGVLLGFCSCCPNETFPAGFNGTDDNKDNDDNNYKQTFYYHKYHRNNSNQQEICK